MRPTNTGNPVVDNRNKKINQLKNKAAFGGTGNPITVGDKTFKPGDKGYKDASSQVSSALNKSMNKNSGEANKGVPTKDTKFATDKLLNKNRTDGKTYSAADAKRMEKSFNQRLQSEPDFDEFDDVPVVNSKGKKVKKIPGTNPISGGTKKQSDSVNQNISSF